MYNVTCVEGTADPALVLLCAGYGDTAVFGIEDLTTTTVVLTAPNDLVSFTPTIGNSVAAQGQNVFTFKGLVLLSAGDTCQVFGSGVSTGGYQGINCVYGYRWQIWYLGV